MRTRCAALAIFAVAFGAVGLADEVGTDAAIEPAWGTASAAQLNLHAFEFVPIRSDTTYGFTNWMKYITSGYPALTAGVHLPAGSRVAAFGVYGCDDSNDDHFSLKFWRCPLDSGACDSPFVVVESTGPACSFWGLSGLSYTIDNSTYSYFLEFTPEVFTEVHRLRYARVLYYLQVSPAPAVATFADVPVGAFGFQHVEALAASGITGGCGGGNFCPNEPLTRVQMAVFLAKALGLHWPY